MRVLFEPERGQRVPVHLWGRRPPEDAARYLQRVASQPWVVDHVAGMADLHRTETAAVGTVFATEHFVVPAALGSDLGCGVALAPLELLEEAPADPHALRAFFCAASEALGLEPGGSRAPRDAALEALAEPWLSREASTGHLTRAVRHHGPRGLGRLGGGNHFFELDRDASGGLWLQVHSGSGSLGGALAEPYARLARTQGVGNPGALDARSGAGEAYLRDLLLAQDFARANRRAMLVLAEPSLRAHLGASLRWGELLDVPHNFVEVARTERGARLLHRKGATAAAAGGYTVVPGSMGTSTCLARGLGEARAWGSCSHGAGRLLTRSEARRRIDARALRAQLRGVLYDERRLDSLVEEAPSAYRDLAEVLEDQRDLVEPVRTLRPLLVLKD